MIIAHFFLRNVKKKPYLFVETTSSQGLEQPSPAAQMLVEVSMGDKRANWIKKAYYEFSNKFPNLMLLDVMENTIRIESDHPSFDLVFVPREKSKSMAERLIESNEEKSFKSVFKNLLYKQNKKDK